MSPSTVAGVQQVLAWLMPSAHAEALLGDLLEERRLRLQAGSAASVSRWYWTQLASSIPVLLWASMRRPSSFVTVVTAVASYVAAMPVAVVLRTALDPTTTSGPNVIILLSFMTALAASGFVAALIRPGAARLLAVIVIVASFPMLVTDSTSVAFWYDVSFIVLGPLAVTAGAALSMRWRKA